MRPTKGFVLFVPDGAADLDRWEGLSMLAVARTPNADFLALHRLGKGRADAHSIHPVPFCLWNGVERDDSQAFSEDETARVWQDRKPVSHLDLLRLLGVAHGQPGNDDQKGLRWKA